MKYIFGKGVIFTITSNSHTPQKLTHYVKNTGVFGSPRETEFGQLLGKKIQELHAADPSGEKYEKDYGFMQDIYSRSERVRRNLFLVLPILRLKTHRIAHNC